jgi:hypothetical protein
MKTRIRSLSENKYARPEYERRLLLREVPPGIDEANVARIVDRYIPNTRMRLRRIEWRNEGLAEYKLALKFADPSLPSGCVAITNFYLTESEYDEVRLYLGGEHIVKRRYPFTHEYVRFGIDVFDGPHAGLILAEAAFETGREYESFVKPDFAVEDVTSDPFFTGGALARVPEASLRRVLDERLKRG